MHKIFNSSVAALSHLRWICILSFFLSFSFVRLEASNDSIPVFPVLNGVIVNLPDEGMFEQTVTLFAEDFLLDNFNYPPDWTFSFSADPTNVSQVFSDDDVGINVLTVYATDGEGDQNYVEVLAQIFSEEGGDPAPSGVSSGGIICLPKILTRYGLITSLTDDGTALLTPGMFDIGSENNCSAGGVTFSFDSLVVISELTFDCNNAGNFIELDIFGSNDVGSMSSVKNFAIFQDNLNACEEVLTCLPQPVLLNALSLNLPPCGCAVIRAEHFNIASRPSTCAMTNDLQFSFSADVNDVELVVTCEQIGQQLTTVWVTDAEGHQNYAEVSYIVQDNWNSCDIDPLYDNACMAVNLNNNINGDTLQNQSNMLASVENNEPAPGDGDCAIAWCDGGVADNTLWYYFSPSEAGTFFIETGGFNTQLALWQAGSFSDLFSGSPILVGANDDRPGSDPAQGSQIEAMLEIDQRYYIQVDGFAGATGTFWLLIRQPVNCEIDSIPVEGLVAYYPFDGTTEDLSGNEYDGTLVGDPEFVEGKVGGAIHFDGNGDYVLANPDLPMGAAPRTLCTWIKSDDNTLQGNADHVVAWGTAMFQQAFGIMIYQGNTWYLYGQNDVNSNIPVNTGWHFHSITLDGNTAQYFYDGRLVATQSIDLNTVGSGLYFGARPDLDPFNYFNGAVDETRIYDRVLANEEIQALYENTNLRLLLHYDFEACSGDTLIDRSGNGNTGLMLGGVSCTPDGAPDSGAGLSLDGIDDYVQTPLDANFLPLSVSVWFNPGVVGGERSIVDSDAFGESGHSIIMGYFTGGNTLDVQYHDSYFQSDLEIQPDQWYHAVALWDEGVVRLYVNGVFIGEQSYPQGNLNGSDFRIGRHNPFDPQWYAGLVDEVKIFEGLLTENQICQLNGSPQPLNLALVSTDPTCAGEDDGAINLLVGGGVPSYTYTWDNPAVTGNSPAGLPGGNYHVTVTDALGNTQTALIILTEPDSILPEAAELQGVSCHGESDGQAQVTVPGGVEPYTFLWDNGEATDTAIMLGGGAHTVVVTDANGCTATTEITITEPPLLEASIIDVAGVSCNGESDGSAEAVASGGTPPYSYAWDNGEATDTAIMLGGGAHTVVVTDANGCTATTEIIITEPPPLEASTIDVAGVSCNGESDGSAEAVASGGTPPYSYAWDNGETTAKALMLPGGTRSVEITDTNGCSLIQVIEIDEPPLLTATITTTPDTNDLANGVITILPEGGTPPYQYSLDNGVSFQPENEFASLAAGEYVVIIRDANDCELDITGTVDMVTGINDLAVAGRRITARLFPTLTSEAPAILVVDGAAGLQINIMLISALGQPLQSINWEPPADEARFELDLSSYPAGEYFVALKVKDKIWPAGRIIRL